MLIKLWTGTFDTSTFWICTLRTFFLSEGEWAKSTPRLLGPRLLPLLLPLHFSCLQRTLQSYLTQKSYRKVGEKLGVKSWGTPTFREVVLNSKKVGQLKSDRRVGEKLGLWFWGHFSFFRQWSPGNFCDIAVKAPKRTFGAGKEPRGFASDLPKENSKEHSNNIFS